MFPELKYDSPNLGPPQTKTNSVFTWRINES